MTEHDTNPAASSPEPRERDRPHQERTEAVLRALYGDDLVAPEVAAPRVPSAIDVVVRDAGRVLDAWGPLEDRVRDRRLIVEHFSQPPSPSDLSRAFAKACWAIAGWSERGDAERPPLLVVLSVGWPRSALALWCCLAKGRLTGLYEADGPPEAVLVDARSLPARPGTSLLRFFDHRPEVAEDNVRSLWADPAIGKMTKDALRRAIMSDPKTFERERPLTLEEVEERVRGDDREAVLAQARERLGAEAVAELEGIGDFGALLARYSELLAGGR